MLSKKIKIVIADDHRIFREGLKLMLAGVSSIDLLGEASDGNQLIALVASVAPDVIITDVKMPNLTGTEAVKILCAKYPGIRIIALTSFGEDQQIIEMIGGASRIRTGEKALQRPQFPTSLTPHLLISINLDLYFH